MSVVLVVGGERLPLRHGQHPQDLLAEHGWVGEPVGSGLGRRGEVELHYDVTPVDAQPPVPVRSGGPGARRLQRVGSYAIVVSSGRLLMSQLADGVVGGAGLWALPGGGVDPGEEPVAGLVREVHEETGQHVVPGDLVQVQSVHRVDAGAPGAGEDFHAVRLVHLAHCPEPRPARVVEVDGSTGAAAWVPLAEVPALPLGSMMAPLWPWVPGSDSYPL